MSNQTICQNCKAALEEGAVFCPLCGTKKEIITPAKKAHFCSQCGTEASAELAFCQECGNALNQNEQVVAASVKEPSTATANTEHELVTSSDTGKVAQAKTSKINVIFKKPIYLPIAAFILLFLVIALVVKIKPSGSSHLIYAKDSELHYSYLSNQKSFELTNRLAEGTGYFDADDFMELSTYILMSDDERYIYYPDRSNGNEATYYWRDLKSNNSKSDTNIKIDSEISSQPFLSKDGSKFFYLKGYDDRLYVYDRKTDEKIKLDDEVRSFFVSDSGDYIIYNKYMNDEYSIYEMSMKGTSSEKNKIDSNSTIRAAYPNDKKIFYQKDDTLYLMESGKDKEKISSDIDSVISIIDKSAIYYLKKNEVVNNLSNYINDDMAAEDRDTIELPSITYTDEPLYPSESDYQIETWVSTYWGYSRHPETDEWGTWEYTTDEDAYRVALEEYQALYASWEESVAEYNREYDAAYLKLIAKEYRDEIRDYINNEENAISYNEYSLYYWNKGTETLVATDVSDTLSSSSLVSALVYQKNNISSIETQKLSELHSNDEYYSIYDYIYDLQDKIRASRNKSDDIYVAIGNKEVTTIDCIDARNWSISDAGAIYFLDNYKSDKGYGDFMSVVIKNGSIEKPVKIDDDVMGYQFGNENDNIFYYKDIKNYSGDVYLNNKLIASDVYINSIYNYKGTSKLLYIMDYSDRSQSGTLCLFDKEVTKIADDVSFFVPINDKDIAYLADYRFNREKGDLMLYRGKKKPTPIDTDVSALLWNPNMVWTEYWYYYY